MVYPVINAGKRITTALLNAMIPVTVYKSADQTVNNSATLVDAADLSFTADANATYRIRLWASYSSNTTPDIKFNWTIPSGASMQRYTLGPPVGTTDTTTTTVTMRRRSSTDAPQGGDGNTNFTTYNEEVILRTTNSGDVKLRFAQNTANASDTILRADTFIEYRRDV